MMNTDLKLGNLHQQLPLVVRRQAEKKNVRECDEEPKGTFVAYVDDGADTFDVHVKIEQTGEIAQMSCDCGKKSGVCAHKAALLLHLAESLGTRSKKTRGPKANPNQLLLDAVSYPELKAWVAELLEKNKDLALSFRHHFGNTNRNYTPQEVSKLTDDAFRAVVKNKRKIDLSELKKVVALWQQVHQPVMNQVLTALHDSEHFTNFRTLVDSCLDYHRNLRLNSKKISSYVQQLVKSASGSLLTLEDEGLWNRVVNLFLENAYLRLGEAGIYFMNQLIERIPEMPDPRQSAAIRLTMDSFKRNRKKNGAVTALTLLHFKMTCDLGYFEEYNSDFEPVSWQNDYNLDLIRRLIALGMTERAERYCIQQIRGNYRDEYNVPYQILLRNMYRQEGKTSKYLEVASQLLSHFFIYEDFVAISNSFSNENEKLKWRKKVRDHAVNLSNRGNGNANAFLFTDAEAEGKFLQMSRYIKNCTPLETILHYFEKMADPNSDELLMAVFERTEFESDFFEDELIHEEERDLFPQLIEAMRTHYPKKKVLSAARRYETHRFYGQNDFIEMLFKEFKSGES